MKKKLITQIAASLLLLFSLGAVCGFSASSRIQSGRPAMTKSEEWARRWIDRRMEQEFARLDATPEQEAALRASYEQLLSEFNAIQAEASEKVAEAFKRQGGQMWKALDPERREILRQIRQERRDRRTSQP